MKKFAVHYDAPYFEKSYIHVWAIDEEMARQQVMTVGVGYHNGKIIPTSIIKVEIVQT